MPGSARAGHVPKVSIGSLPRSLPAITAPTPPALLIIIIYLLRLHLEATGRVREHSYGELAVIFQGGNIYLSL